MTTLPPSVSVAKNPVGVAVNVVRSLLNAPTTGRPDNVTDGREPGPVGG
ncbi:MAG: hypothetical protein ABIS86_13835 [Streptosporangiaceae bacterium]